MTDKPGVLAPIADAFAQQGVSIKAMRQEGRGDDANLMIVTHIAREQALYRNTHSFLPERHGLRPNTLHLFFDVVTVAILITLAVLTAQAR